MPNLRYGLTLPKWRGYQMVLMTTSSWYQIVMNKLYPCSQSWDLECNSYLYHQRKRCCIHQSSCLLSGLRQRSAFLLHSVLERFLSTCKAIKFFFCRGKILSRRTSQVLIFLPNCGFFLWVCYVPIGEWQSICNDWMLNGHHCAFSNETTSIRRNMADGRSWNFLLITISVYFLVW